MKRSLKTTLLWGVLAIVLLAPGSKAFALPTLQIIPASASIVQGGNFTLDIGVAGVTDLYSFQFDLAFNPAVLQATASSEGAFLPSGGTTFFLEGAIDNTSGLVSFIADTLIAPIPGVTGTGTLASISFNALSVGTSALTLSNVVFLDSGLNEIGNVTSVGGTIGVTPTAQPIPEPSSLVLMLMASGFLALAGAKRSSANH